MAAAECLACKALEAREFCSSVTLHDKQCDKGFDYDWKPVPKRSYQSFSSKTEHVYNLIARTGVIAPNFFVLDLLMKIRHFVEIHFWKKKTKQLQ